MSDDLPEPALQKRLGAAGNRLKGIASGFGTTTANVNNTENGNFSPIMSAVSFAPNFEGGVNVNVDSEAAQRLATVAAAGAANSYLQQRTYGMVGLGGGDNGAGGLTIGGVAPSDLANLQFGDTASDATNSYLRSRTGGLVEFGNNAEGGVLGGLTVGGTAAKDLINNSEQAARVAGASANTYLQNQTGGLVSFSSPDGDGRPSLTIGGNAAGALTKGMDPITGAIATGAANMMLQQKSGGMVSLNNNGNITLQSNATVDRRMQEARATAMMAGNTLTGALGSVGGGFRSGGNDGSAIVNVDGSAQSPSNAMGGAVFDVARSEFQARWARMVEEEERLRKQSLDVDRREKQLTMKTTRQAPNFPPIRFLCIKPVVHHNIAGDIPIARQTYIKACYGTFYGTALMLIANLALIIANVASCGSDKLSDGNLVNFNKHIILPIVYLVGIVAAFFVWYHPIYSACATGSSITYVMAFIGIFVAFAFAVFQAVGPEGYGGAGILYALLSGDRCGTTNFLMILPVAILWACLAVVMFAFGMHLIKYYKEDQASLNEAREQLKAQVR